MFLTFGLISTREKVRKKGMKQESISKQRCVGHRQRTGEANPDEKGEIDHKDVLSVVRRLACQGLGSSIS